MNWEAAIAKILPYLVRIEVVGQHGSGFILEYDHETQRCVIATAGHVTLEGRRRSMPVTVTHHASGKTISIQASDDVVKHDFPSDAGCVLISGWQLNAEMPIQPNFVLATSSVFVPGQDVGFHGFPFVEAWTPCFFGGHVSARPRQNTFLISTYAMRGVSGSPVFRFSDGGELVVGGVVVGSNPDKGNDATQLPGLTHACDIARLTAIASRFEGVP